MSTAPNYDLAIKKAQEILKNNFITEPPIDVVTLAINEGLNIFQSEFEDESISGYLNPNQKAIYVNSNESPNRKNFTIAHELGHWFLHKDKLGNELDSYAILYRKSLGEMNRDPLEQEANCFAAELLVPIEILKKYKTDKLVSELARLFNVSVDVIGFRLQKMTTL